MTIQILLVGTRPNIAYLDGEYYENIILCLPQLPQSARQKISELEGMWGTLGAALKPVLGLKGEHCTLCVHGHWCFLLQICF